MKNILIIKLSSLGDVFLALPHIDAILDHHCGDRVWLLTSPEFVPVFENHPRLQVVKLDRRRWFAGESVWGVKAWVKQQNFHTVYDLQGNRASKAMVRAAKAVKTVGKGGGFVYNCFPEKDDEEKHIFERLRAILASAGINHIPEESTIYPSKTDIDRVETWKKEHGLRDNAYVLLHAGSSPEWPSKKWAASYFSRLSMLLEQEGFQCVWVGGKDDKGLNKNLAAKSGFDATGKFNVIQLYLMGQKAEFAVTNDSGPMHILSVSGIPVFGFFGPTSWKKSHGAGQRKRVIHNDTKCSPCYKKVCPGKKGHICLDSIHPEDVMAAIKKEIGA